jgi:hypothetical protein
MRLFDGGGTTNSAIYSALTNVIIEGNTLTSIRDYAFCGLDHLTTFSVASLTSVPAISSNVFTAIDRLDNVSLITSTNSAVACAFANHTEWRKMEHGAAKGSKYFGKAVPTNGSGYPASSPNDFRFYMDCNKKLTVTKTGTATNITSDFGSGGANQPWKNIGMTYVEIGAGIQETGKDMFSSNTTITTMKFPAGFKKLGTSTCNQCTQINSIDMTALTGGSADVPEILNATYNITKVDKSSTAERGKITLLIQNGMVGPFSTGTTTGNKHLWKEYIIPQLMFKFDTQGGVFQP